MYIGFSSPDLEHTDYSLHAVQPKSATMASSVPISWAIARLRAGCQASRLCRDGSRRPLRSAGEHNYLGPRPTKDHGLGQSRRQYRPAADEFRQLVVKAGGVVVRLGDGLCRSAELTRGFSTATAVHGPLLPPRMVGGIGQGRRQGPGFRPGCPRERKPGFLKIRPNTFATRSARC